MSSGHKRYHSHGAHPANEPSRTAKRCREPNPDGLSGQHEITPNKYTVGWVCALPLEMAAAKGMLDKVHPNPTEQDPSDHNTYLLGEVCGHNVVVACLPAGIYGITPAATVAKDMLRTFTSIRFGLMVGIGGGIPSQHHDVRLGDIVVAQPTANNGGVIQFDRGKWLQEWNFQHTGTLSPPPQVLLAALSRLQAEHLTADSRILEFLDDLPEKMKERFRHPGALNDRLYVASYCHEDNETNCQLHDSSFIVARVDRDNPGPAIHYGTIASGNQVVKDATLRDQLGQKLGALCFEMEAAGLQDFPSLVIRGICDYADSHKNKMWQFYAAAVAAAFAKELLSVIPPSRVLQEDPIPQLVSIASEQLDVSKQHLEVSSQQLREHQRMNRIIIDRAIDLHIIHEARYDSADVGSSPRCEENTRVRFQQTIEEWANAVDGEPFLWIVGPAGTGKSTLVRSIADSLHEAKKLIAGYFFKRGEQGRNDTNRLFPTLAMQLADNDRSFRTSLRASLRDNDKDSIDKKDLRFQFEKLLKGPLENLYPLDSSQGNKIIILDALDECESPENVPRILSLFLEICNKSTPLGLRLLLTSRPDLRIVDAFESLMQRGVAQQLQLHRIFSDDTKTDIRLYLENSFARVKRETRIQQDPWPTVEDLDRLVELSTNPEPLFIYASTLLRFIYDERRLQSPKNQLTIWLKQCQENKSQLHQIYNPILEQIFSLAKHTDFDQQLKFLGALVLVATPLSLQSLSSLLDLDVDDVNWWLPGLHAVLDIPSKPHLPIRLLHKSFGDFLLSKENPGHDHLRIDALEVHGLLANRCIELMTRCLKQDICDLRKLDATFEEIDDAKLNCHIPPELQYACLYWVYHLISSENPTYEGILPFLHHHFLHWLEVLALIRRTSDGFKALRGLTDLIKNCSNSLTELVSFLKDATRTITSFATMIETVPLQTYASLLVFSPVESQVRQHFWDQRLPPRVHVEGNRSYWDAYVQTLHGRSGVKKLEFSPDGSFLAAVDHEVVHLMNASTGTYLTVFECPEEPECVVFSPTSQLLAVSESFGRALTIWSTSTWAQVQKIQCEGIVDTMAFSPDGASVIIASVTSLIGRVTFELWDARLGSLQRITSVTKSRYSWSGAAFSPSIQHFATTHTDNTIVLWNLEACTAQHTINTPNRPSVVAFSPDGNLFAAACGDVISMWDTATYTERCDFEILDPGIFKKLTFSPNGELLASVTSKHVAFWETNTGYYRDFEVGHASEVAFSSDSQYLATAKGATIRFWDMTEEYPQVDDEPSFPIEGRYFSCLLSSPKGKLVVSVKGGAVQIWDSFTGMLLRSLKHDMSTASHFQFSPDSKELSFQLSGLQSWKWNMEDGSQEPMLEGYCETLHRPVIFSTNSQIAAVRRSDLIFNFYDTTTGRHVGSLEDCIYNFDAVTLSPDGDLLACWSNGCSIQVWDTKAGKCFLTIDNELHTFDLSMGERACKGVRKSPERSDRLLKFSPNGGILARHDFGGIKWWDIATGLQQATLEPEDGFFQEHAFSPNSLLLAASFSPFPHDLTEQVIQLYDAKTGEYQCTLHGHLGFAVHIVFSPNSLMVAVASDDRTVRLWHTATFIQLHAFQTYHDIPEITRFSDDGTFITVASGDKSIRLWDLTTGRLSQIIYHDEGFIEGLRVLHDQIAVSASNVEVWRWWDSWDTHNLKLLKYHYPLSVDSQPSITERFLSEFSLDADECWIMQGFEKVICIPLEYRPQKEVGDFAPQTRFWIKSGHTVFIACVNGQVVSFKCL